MAGAFRLSAVFVAEGCRCMVLGKPRDAAPRYPSVRIRGCHAAKLSANRTKSLTGMTAGGWMELKNITRNSEYNLKYLA